MAPTDVIEKVIKALNMADGESTEEARDNALRVAGRIAANNGIDLATARHELAKTQKVEDPITKHIKTGEPGKQNNAVWCELAMACGRSGDLKFNISHNSLYVIAFGFPSDIEMCEAMFAHLGVQMVDAANAYLATDDWRDEIVTVWNAKRWEYQTKKVDKRVVKRRFYEAFISQVGMRLAQAKREAEATRVEADKSAAQLTTGSVDEAVTPSVSTGTELVLKEKREKVEGHYRATSRARGSWKGGQGNTAGSSRGSAAGRQAGANARLTGQRALGGPRTGIGG